MVPSSSRTTPFVLVLFVFGLVVGLAAASQLPAPAAESQGGQLTETTEAVPVSAVEDSSCTPATLAERAGQVLVVGMPGVTDFADPLVGELLEVGVGGVFVNDGNVVTAEQVRDLLLQLRTASELPLLVTTDEEGGRVSTFRPFLGATSSPRTLAARGTPEDVRAFAEQLGSSLAALGLNADLAPVADLDAGSSTGVIGDRAFSGDPMTATDYAQAFADGLLDGGILPVVKHFPGQADAVGDVHRGRVVSDVDLADLMSTDVQPFVSLIDAGAPIVMVGHVEYEALDPGRPASVSPTTYALLRELGFQGVAMTDSVGMGAIHRRWKFPRAGVMALRAGADAVLATDGRHAMSMADAIVEAVRDGRLEEDRLNEAAARMLALKGVDPRPFTCVSTETIGGDTDRMATLAGR